MFPKAFGKKPYCYCAQLSSLLLPFSGFMSPIEWCDDALEFGVVDTVDIGEPGFMSFGVVLPALADDDLPSDLISEPLSLVLLLVTFCWARRSCLRNLARRFWNHTYNKNATIKCMFLIIQK